MSAITIDSDSLATSIANKFDTWLSYRKKREADWEELTRYLFATSTRDTTNSKLLWKNSTTRPKLTQIRENLHANYISAEFASERWLSFVPSDFSKDSHIKAQIAERYVLNKLEQINFDQFISQILLDWIDYGNAFAKLEYVREVSVDRDTGELIYGYVGPKPVRISPYDIVFDPTVENFKNSPKIIRTLIPIGELINRIESYPDYAPYADVIDKVKGLRTTTSGDSHKDSIYNIAGFGSYQQYLDSEMVEILEFYGTLWDKNSGELLKNRYIAVVDRQFVAINKEIDSWIGSEYIYHTGWRKRPDTLWAMSPLDNLVGMQYRIDHLENLKADIFDMLAHPIVVQKGDVTFEGWEPGATAIINDEGAFNIIHPDSSILQANLDIQQLEETMEEMAGAPKMAMGFRTPGEKTAFEIQTLDNAANRVFLSKLAQFEREFLEPLITDFFEMSRRYFDGYDVVSIMDEELGIKQFLSITKEDLSVKGTFKARGARYIANKNKLFQELLQYNNSILQDPTISSHISGKKLAKMTAELLGEPELYKEGIRIIEQGELQKIQLAVQDDIQEAAHNSADMADGEEQATGDVEQMMFVGSGQEEEESMQ